MVRQRHPHERVCCRLWRKSVYEAGAAGKSVSGRGPDVQGRTLGCTSRSGSGWQVNLQGHHLGSQLCDGMGQRRSVRIGAQGTRSRVVRGGAALLISAGTDEATLVRGLGAAGDQHEHHAGQSDPARCLTTNCALTVHRVLISGVNG
jgi:hypothetical protein